MSDDKTVYIPSFCEWNLSEANTNLWKVRDSDEPVIGPQIFTPNEFQNLIEVQKKLDDNLKGYEEHMKIADEKQKEWIAKLEGKKGTKSTLDWYQQADKTRKLAFDIVKKASEFMKKHNELYDSLKEDFTSTDHIRVASAISKMLQIYPYALITEAGKLKRMKRMKFDTEFITSVIKWTNSIMNRKNMLEDASKLLGKSEKQIEGAKKQAAAQRARWGMY